MFSRCPHCDAQQTVTAQQLRSSRGLLLCESCRQRFDALATLSDDAGERLEQSQSDEFLFDPAPKIANTRRWQIANLLMLLALTAQLGYFEGDRLLRQPQLRRLLLQVCLAWDCRLPAYKNLDEWSLSHGDLETHLDHRYVFTAALTNQADFAQAFPNLKLTLMNFNGQALAERVFAPQQYAPGVAELAANDTHEIRLNLVLPAGDVGGFTFSLL